MGQSWTVCSRCGIPDFLAIYTKVIKGKVVCDACETPLEERRALAERCKKLGLIERKKK